MPCNHPSEDTMRALFGLVGLLVGVGVLIWFMGSKGGGLDQTQQVLKSGESAREQISQVGGIDSATGRSAMSSAELEEINANGKTTGLKVNAVTPGGAYERFFGLQKDDTIVAVIYSGLRQNIRDMSDPEMAKAQVSDTFSKQGQLVVKRGNSEITLPQSGDSAPKKDALQQQLDAIPGVR
jgi:hypothetical protein